MNLPPLISVLMTAFNREQFIAEAIESVLASTYKNWELIITDDCSKDGTVSMAKEYANKDSRIKVFQNEKNLGDYPNRNYAASLAKGEFIIYVDSDDRILPGGIAELIRNMCLFPEASFGIYSPLPGIPFELKSAEAIHSHFFKKPFLMIGPGGTIQRLSFFKKMNGFPEKYGPANDRYYNLKVCCYSSIVMMPFEFMYYRRHKGQEINNTLSYLYNNYLYLKDALTDLPFPLNEEQTKWIDKKNKRRFFVNVVEFFFRTGKIGVTIHVFKITNFRFRDALMAAFHI